jgi:hypothetical protein
MKKLTALILAAVLPLALAACGSGSGGGSGGGGSSRRPSSSSSQNDSTQPGGSASGEAMNSLAKWMIDGSYSYDFRMYTEGPEGRYEGIGSAAMDGDKIATRQEMIIDGQKMKSWVIVKGGVSYILYEDSKSYMTIPAEDAMDDGLVEDYSGIVKTGEGTGEIDGRRLPYEEYFEGSGVTMRYYLDGGDVYGIVTEAEGYKTTMILSNISSKAPAGAFDIPAGYTDMGSLIPSFDFDFDDFDIDDLLPSGFEWP